MGARRGRRTTMFPPLPPSLPLLTSTITLTLASLLSPLLSLSLYRSRFLQHQLPTIDHLDGYSRPIAFVCRYGCDALNDDVFEPAYDASEDDVFAWNRAVSEGGGTPTSGSGVGYVPFRWGHSFRVMKNWELLVFGPLLAMQRRLVRV